MVKIVELVVELVLGLNEGKLHFSEECQKINDLRTIFSKKNIV